jgi:hypothetical protein
VAICGNCGRRGSVAEIRACSFKGTPHEGEKVPKVKWGKGLTADAIDNASDSGQVYEGKIPPAGVYTFEIRTMKYIAKNSNGNPMVSFMLLMDDPRKEMKEFAGCPLFSQIVVVEQNDWRIKEFTRSLGISARDFLDNCVTDENGAILKFGALKVAGAGLHVKVNAKREPTRDDPDTYRLDVKNFMPLRKAEDSEAEAKPKKGKKAPEPAEEPSAAKKGKKGADKTPEPAATKQGGKKGKKSQDEEPPF